MASIHHASTPLLNSAVVHLLPEQLPRLGVERVVERVHVAEPVLRRPLQRLRVQEALLLHARGSSRSSCRTSARRRSSASRGTRRGSRGSSPRGRGSAPGRTGASPTGRAASTASPSRSCRSGSRACGTRPACRGVSCGRLVALAALPQAQRPARHERARARSARGSRRPRRRGRGRRRSSSRCRRRPRTRATCTALRGGVFHLSRSVPSVSSRRHSMRIWWRSLRAARAGGAGPTRGASPAARCRPRASRRSRAGGRWSRTVTRS